MCIEFEGLSINIRSFVNYSIVNITMKENVLYKKIDFQLKETYKFIFETRTKLSEYKMI